MRGTPAYASPISHAPPRASQSTASSSTSDKKPAVLCKESSIAADHAGSKRRSFGFSRFMSTDFSRVQAVMIPTLWRLSFRDSAYGQYRHARQADTLRDNCSTVKDLLAVMKTIGGEEVYEI